jgi:imidazolonepropionase-like amidohydrolase
VEFDAVLESVRLLKDAGVPLLAGTDSGCCGVFGTAPGVSMHRELQLLTQAGLSAIEAIHAATAAPAFAFGLDDRGRIEPGMRADLFLVDGNPTECIEDTVRIAAIWRGGHRADRDLKPESR